MSQVAERIEADTSSFEAGASVYWVTRAVESLAETVADPDARIVLTGKDAGELEAAVSTLMRIIAEIDNEPR